MLWIRLLPLLAAAAAAAACGRAGAPGPDVVARLDRDPIHYQEFEAFLHDNGAAQPPPRDAEVLGRLFDQFLDERLLRRAAVEQGLVGPGAGARAAVEALLEAQPPAEPSRTDLETYFAAHRQEFVRPERVHLRQMVYPSLAEARRAEAELAAGAAFPEVASRSRGPAASRGGDQGILAREDLPPAFAEVIFGLAPGERSPILEAEYGWLIFQVAARLPAVEPSFAEAEAELRDLLRRQAADRRLAALVDAARSRYTIEVYAANLPFRYRGPYAPAL